MATSPDRAVAAAFSMQIILLGTMRRQTHKQIDILPPPSSARLHESLDETPFDLHEYLAQPEKQRGTVLYLAYGSNLSNETFRGKRGIKPLSQINVQVPSLRMTFDLPGLPYAEPCFANSGTRDPENDPPRTLSQTASSSEKSPLLGVGEQASGQGYHKDSWHKGLIGVVYECTPEDYAHIIATEGGGASYHDVLVECHPFASADPATPVLQDPTTPPFKAHTLFAPATSPGDVPKQGGRVQRPDMSYAQPSARYLKLITDGADELGLPYEYRDYLHAIHPYTITSAKQRMGSFIFLAIWAPIIMFIFTAGKMFQDEKGRSPPWWVQLVGAIFRAVWGSYDGFFEPLFGDGERSIPDGGDDARDDTKSRGERRRGGMLGLSQEVDPEKARLVDVR
ncbi:hypothetical protein LTR78_010150 [Recurvomyces mirabilis]|uniref:gamma-glutamylcyclotransferase n=1 Tax=Recurvomyces mirabilis TaxID=574656 RepID=A0AAE0TR03_9PEZI|nr:hypothetical protein LTR78_010150 [Recurvomyces mirabilis]KAK5149941.1 hypothetical protein LTS14_010546 [Recurvomyces mirabilis]